MKFAALPSAYYLRPGFAGVDDAAEVAWNRSVAAAAAAETSGLITPAALPSLVRNPTRARTARVVEQLVTAGLWTPTPGGWLITGWDEDQAALEDVVALQRRRAADAARKRRQRTDSDTGTDPVDKPDNRTSSQVKRGTRRASTRRTRPMSRDIPPTKEVTKEGSAAAAAPRPPTTLAAAEPAAAPGLPEHVHLLRARLELAGLAVRWDTLDPSEVAEIEALIGAHTAPALVRAALAARAAHRTPPAYARAWLSTWRSLPPPGRTLALAPCPDTRCAAGWLPDDPETGAPNPCPSCKPHTRGATA